jgi:hypothetical protein
VDLIPKSVSRHKRFSMPFTLLRLAETRLTAVSAVDTQRGCRKLRVPRFTARP